MGYPNPSTTQQYHLSYPLTASSVLGLNEMIGTLFRDLGNLAQALNPATTAATATAVALPSSIMGQDGEDGDQGIPGPIGPPGALGLAGLMGVPGLDGDDGDMGWPGPAGTAGATGAQGIPGPGANSVPYPTLNLVAMFTWTIGVGEAGAGTSFGTRSAAVGGAASDTVDDTGVYGLQTSSAAGSIFGYTTSSSIIRTNHAPVIYFRLGTGTNIGTVRYWIGMTSAAFADLDNQAIKMVGFRYSTVAGDGGWRGVVDDGTTQSLTATVNGISANTFYTFKIDCSDTNNAVFSINGGATKTLVIPAGTKSTSLRVTFVVISQDATPKVLNERAWYLQATGA